MCTEAERRETERAERVDKLTERIAEALEGAGPVESTQALIAFLAVMHETGVFEKAPPTIREPINTFLGAMGADLPPPPEGEH